MGTLTGNGLVFVLGRSFLSHLNPIDYRQFCQGDFEYVSPNNKGRFCLT